MKTLLNRLRKKMKIKALVAAAALTICSPLFAKNVTNGILSFENSATPKNTLFLNGDWEFYENQTFDTLMGARLKVNFIDVPSSWSSQEIERDERLPKFGTHTYRVLITGLKANYAYGIFSKRTPQYAARIFANGNFLIEYGKFARHKKDYKPTRTTLFCPIVSDKDGIIELVIQVSNYTGGDSGIVAPISFGEVEAIERLQQKLMLANAFVLGLLIFCLLSNYMLWFFDKSKFSNLLFGMLITFIAVRFSLYNLNMIGRTSVFVPFSLLFKLENTIIFASCAFSALYACDKTFFNKHPHVDYPLSTIALTLYITFLCLPIHFAVDFLKPCVIVALAFAFYSLIRFFFALKNREYTAAAYMFFYIIVAIPIAIDILFPKVMSNSDFDPSDIFIPIAAIINITFIAAILEVQQKKNRKIKDTLSQFYFGYRRFMPKNALHFFDNINLGDIKIGLRKERKMTIMFVGIVVMSPDNTKINLREEFETLAFYSSTIIERIHQFGGTVITITNQGISALFKDKDVNALSAARVIRNELQTINSRRAEDYYLCATFNISIHNGKILLGVIGDRNRLDLTTISSGIEVIDKMCSLGFAMNIPILISQPTVETFPEETKSELKLLGNIHFSEFTRPIGIYGLLSSEEEENSLENIDETPFITQREADKYINF